MQWHKGEIFEAVNKVNRVDQFLVVFLRDNGASSVHYNNVFENSKEIHELLCNCVCLNLLQGETVYQQFTEVYNALEVPSIYIITHLGQVVDIIKEDITDDMLISKLKKSIAYDLNVSKSVEKDSKVNTNSIGGGEADNESVDDKMLEIRQKLAEKHRQRKEEEKAKEIEDELSRRELGKKVVELKKFQKEQEENEIKDEIRRKKQEDKDARDKVLRQIEEDKKERKKRFVDQIASPINTDNNIEANAVTQRQCVSSLTSRLQFRFPDGSSKNNTFNCDDKFGIVRLFVAAHVRDNMNSRKFEIKQFFPKKTLSKEDDLLSLKELQLVPSSSLAVIFLDQSTVSSPSSVLTSVIFGSINIITSTILTIFLWIKGRLFNTAPRHEDNRDTVNGNRINWEERQRRLIAAESRTIKKDGNIAQLSDPSKKKDDKDDATWNGNSTQQM